ncbi:Uncharacterised protein [Shigella sonnei]|nr:Uncharacterised protein [Shigella sonnei]
MTGLKALFRHPRGCYAIARVAFGLRRQNQSLQ